MSSTHEVVLSLIRLGMGHEPCSLPEPVDWFTVKVFAEQQGLLGLLQDCLEKLPLEQRPPQPLMLEWIGEVLQEYEYRYEMYRRTIVEMARFYNEHGYKMMVLKGFACSLDWPKPEHRPCGDIDIWQFGQQIEADALVASEKGIEVDNSHHHHTVFCWRDFVVENHYDFINVHHRASSPKLEKIFKKLGKDDSCCVKVSGESLYLPSPNLNALFLLRHAMQHFVGAKLTLRQLLDWAFFVEKHGNNVDWKWLTDVLDDFGMRPAFEIFDAICVEDLGFNFDRFKTYGFYLVQVDGKVKERVLNDILLPEFREEKPIGFLSRLMFKYRRWRSNGWKSKLCFNESMWSAFWCGVLNHLLKPKSI